MGLPAKSPQAILWDPRKEGEQYSHVSGLHPIPQEWGGNTPMSVDHTRTCFKLFNMCLKFKGWGIDI